jgi:hypothetical protein
VRWGGSAEGGNEERPVARVERAILDDGVEACGDASVGEGGGGIVLVGKRAVVEPGTRLAAGPCSPNDD